MKGYRAFLDKYLPGADPDDLNYLYGYMQGMLLEQLIKQCGGDLSRTNVVKQAKSFHKLVLPVLLPGIEINTSEKSNRNFGQLRLQRWSGRYWELFGGVLDASVN